MTKKYNFFISCQIGFEEMVKNELIHALLSNLEQYAQQPLPLSYNLSSEDKEALTQKVLSAAKVQVKVGGLMASLTLSEVYTFIYWSRLAARVLLVLRNDFCDSDLDLYNSIYSINWNDLLHPDFEFMVNFNGTSGTLRNTQFSSFRVKDALLDYYQQFQQRPNVNTEEPDVIIDCRLHQKRVQISLDLTGPLHRRYRHHQGSAPMRETLAANLVLRTSWDKESPVYNPMCGSGVLAIEAAMIALNIAPGLYSEQHQLDFWKGHNLDLWLAARQRAQESKRDLPNFKVFASDNDKAVLEVAQANIDYVGLGDTVELSYANSENLERQETSDLGLVIVNPPYGVRLSNERELYNTYFSLGEMVKKNFPGWVLGVISSSVKLLDCLPLSPQRKWNIRNSNLDCQFRVYTLRSQASLVKKEALEQEEGKKALEKALAIQKAQEEDFSKDSQALALYNRLNKNKKRLNSYLKRNKVNNYRLYDADIPEYNVAVDRYQDKDSGQVYYVVQEYAASKEIALHKTVKRSLQALAMVQRYAEEEAQALNLPFKPQIIDKLRERKKGDSQYTRIATEKLEFWIEEYGCEFKVNLTDYIDTGIFLDNRDLRKFLAQLTTKDTNFLNLFSYTSTATGHVLTAKAKATTSVDMSANYCQWSAENLRANFLAHFPKKLHNDLAKNHRIIQADVLAWLDDQVANLPTFNQVSQLSKDGKEAKSQLLNNKVEFNSKEETTNKALLTNSKGKITLQPKDKISLTPKDAEAFTNKANNQDKEDFKASLSFEKALTKIPSNPLGYDLIFCDPPTFSNSKRMEGTFDVQRDHVDLLGKIAQLLKADGKLVFCNNKRGFKLDYDALKTLGLKAEDITRKTMPQDFLNSKIHQAWLITFSEEE